MTDKHETLSEVARLSHEVIVKNQHSNGAYPASPTFSAYRGYSWLRDGAFIAEGISRFGDTESVDAFHDWVSARLAERRDQVDSLIRRRALGEVPEANEMLPTRFPIEDPSAPDTWWNFQTDGYGAWLWSIAAHARRHGLSLVRWQSGIEVAVDYATAFWDLPCYDWWEENIDRQHGSTLGALYGGMSTIAASGALDDERVQNAVTSARNIRRLVMREGLSGDSSRLSKWLGNDAVDASLASCVVPFGMVAVDDPIAHATLAAIANGLDVGGGVHRYLADVFYGGGQWLLLSGLLGWNLAAQGNTDGALVHLQWMASQLTIDGEFPEQVPDHLLHPEHRSRWIDEWGPAATPLLWSHGMYLILADELGLIPK